MAKIVEVRNSTAEFLTFVAANKEDGVQVVYKDETIWATQAAMGELFGVEAKTIGFHLQNIFNEGELQQDRTTQKIGVVQLEGSRNVMSVRYWTMPARCRTNTPRRTPKRNSSATASSRTAYSAATSRRCSWMEAICPSCRWKGCQRRGISN